MVYEGLTLLFVTLHRGLSPRQAKPLLATDDPTIVTAVLRALCTQLPEVKKTVATMPSETQRGDQI